MRPAGVFGVRRGSCEAEEGCGARHVRCRSGTLVVWAEGGDEGDRVYVVDASCRRGGISSRSAGEARGWRHVEARGGVRATTARGSSSVSRLPLGRSARKVKFPHLPAHTRFISVTNKIPVRCYKFKKQTIDNCISFYQASLVQQRVSEYSLINQTHHQTNYRKDFL